MGGYYVFSWKKSILTTFNSVLAPIRYIIVGFIIISRAFFEKDKVDSTQPALI